MPEPMPDPAVLGAELLRHGTATLGESGARRMRSRIRPVWSGAEVAGPAVPVRCTPGDNLGIHVGVTVAAPGSVLVVDVGEERELGFWGEVLTTAAQARGIAGLVIDGGVRDVDALAVHGFPVFSSGIALTGATKEMPGSVNRPIVAGDVEVEAGDWIVGDVDGVVVVPRADVEAVLAAAQLRTDREARFIDALKAGQTTIDLLGLDSSPIDVD
jgi:4-hydroxy-4-methyl-2-oxoglutarate aldolase